MNQGSPHTEINQAFCERPDLQKRVYSALEQYPKHASLFRDISTYVLELRSGTSTSANGTAEPASKKRRLDDGSAPNNGVGASVSSTWRNVTTQAYWQSTDVSFTVPQRKKLTLQLVAASTQASEGGIRAINSATGTVEFGIAWRDVEQIFCLPVPEKAKRQHNFVVISKGGDGVNPVPEGITVPEPMVWAFDEAIGKNIKEGEDPGPGTMAAEISQHLKPYGKRVVFPEEREFASAIPQSHRKGEKAFHVKAFRGSKDGFLFLLSTGILWGFKKPLAYFSFTTIDSVSYTSVLQRTFNLNIATPSQEIEFSMVDQEDYAGIDAYVKKHGLNDASMAEQRRAKKLNVNGPSKPKTEGGADDQAAKDAVEGDEEETELQKAERLLQDAEDDEEEDYDPGSEGDSEGEGDSSDEEEYEEGEGEEVDEEEAEDGDDGEDEGEEDGHGEGEAPEYVESHDYEMQYDGQHASF